MFQRKNVQSKIIIHPPRLNFQTNSEVNPVKAHTTESVQVPLESRKPPWFNKILRSEPNVLYSEIC